MMARAILDLAVKAHDASTYGMRGVNIGFETAEVFASYLPHQRLKEGW